MTLAAICSFALGLGFGLPAIAGARHFAESGQIWTFMGFPTYGGGPFERVGIGTSVPLLLAFVLVCVAEVVLGALLLLDFPHARTFAYLLLPIEMVFWVGFALPFGPPIGIARTVLLLLA